MSVTTPDAAPASRDSTPGGARGLASRLAASPELSILVALAVVVVVFGALRPSVFLTWDNINSILVAAAILIVLAVGQTYVVVTAGHHLSIKATLTLGAGVFGRGSRDEQAALP